MISRALTIVVSSALAGAVLAGCSSSTSTDGSGSTSASSSAATSPVTSTPAPVTATPAPVTTSAAQSSAQVLTAAANQHTQDALAAWKQGAAVPSAETNVYLSKAENDLRAAVSSDSFLAGTYNPEIADLKQLISIPETDVTPAQMAEAKQDVASLNTFFATPGLYS